MDQEIYTFQFQTNQIQKKEITLTNNNPYNIFFINRENLFSNCSDKEPYNCTLKIEISGNNIPFTLLIIKKEELLQLEKLLIKKKEIQMEKMNKIII